MGNTPEPVFMPCTDEPIYDGEGGSCLDPHLYETTPVNQAEINAYEAQQQQRQEEPLTCGGNDGNWSEFDEACAGMGKSPAECEIIAADLDRTFGPAHNAPSMGQNPGGDPLSPAEMDHIAHPEKRALADLAVLASNPGAGVGMMAGAGIRNRFGDGQDMGEAHQDLQMGAATWDLATAGAEMTVAAGGTTQPALSTNQPARAVDDKLATFKGATPANKGPQPRGSKGKRHR